MVDFSAIKSEIMTVAAACASPSPFKSTNAVRVRPNVALAAMPACDIRVRGHRTTYDANRHYQVPLELVIRQSCFDRDDNVAAFEILVEQVTAAIESHVGVAYFRIREIGSDLGEYSTDDGLLVRRAVLTMNVHLT